MAVRKYQKPPNGQAQSGSYLLVFDLDDEAQAKAWEVAQQLASQRKLKHVLVGMLLAVHTVQEQTGKALDLLQFMASFITGLINGGGGGYGRMQITEQTEPEELPSMFAGTDDHADPTEARDNFSAGMGDLFGDDEDDDLWD
ncbi:MAG: hypothetical protein D6698_02965 [Gammaproteobacteria bacterium]|nr:MAG: hypothetical protein D6698_02965 [Gammaproteobacteria bacterium]